MNNKHVQVLEKYEDEAIESPHYTPIASESFCFALLYPLYDLHMTSVISAVCVQPVPPTTEPPSKLCRPLPSHESLFVCFQLADLLEFAQEIKVL